MKLKILQITNFFKPSWETGGVTKVAYEISKKLIERGHEITVYTTDGFKSRLDVEKNKPVSVDGIRTYYFRNLSSFLTRKINLPIPYYLQLIAKEEVKNYDIIHIHEHRTLLAVIIHYYSNKYKIPYVLQAHGSVLPFFQKQRLKKIFDIFFGYTILKDASKLIALNENEALHYEKMGVDSNKIEIVSNGINLEEYNIPPMKGAFRKNNSIDQKANLVLYVGRINKNKGLDLLVKSFSNLLKIGPNSVLVIVGPDEGGFKHKLEDLIQKLNIKNNVMFTGFVDSNIKMAALNDADVFVTASFSGFPMTFLEACVFGLPIITTKKGDNLYWIHNRIGYVVQYDENELCKAIYELLKNEDLRSRFGEESKKLIEKQFLWNSIIKNIESIYLEVISRYEKTI